MRITDLEDSIVANFNHTDLKAATLKGTFQQLKL